MEDGFQDVVEDASQDVMEDGSQDVMEDASAEVEEVSRKPLGCESGRLTAGVRKKFAF